MSLFYEEQRASLYVGDCCAVLATLPPGVARTCVTSPPYWGLRDYGVAGQLGAEATPDEYVSSLVAVFREVRRVLADDGTLWLNLGDSYAGSWGARGRGPDTNAPRPDFEAKHGTGAAARHGLAPWGVKPKDLMGMPWRVAFALQADGWWLRSDVVWSKPNPMPESITDRPTKAHEYVFLLTKTERYFYDQDATREPHQPERKRGRNAMQGQAALRPRGNLEGEADYHPKGRNARTVWSIATQPSGVEHFATMPAELARRCILAGSAPGDTVLDPFNGAGTTGMVAMKNGRKYLGVELNPEYARETVKRWQRECAQTSMVLTVGAA